MTIRAIQINGFAGSKVVEYIYHFPAHKGLLGYGSALFYKLSLDPPSSKSIAPRIPGLACRRDEFFKHCTGNDTGELGRCVITHGGVYVQIRLSYPNSCLQRPIIVSNARAYVPKCLSWGSKFPNLLVYWTYAQHLSRIINAQFMSNAKFH